MQDIELPDPVSGLVTPIAKPLFHRERCAFKTAELFRRLAFFILSSKPILYCRFKDIDVYIL